MLPFASQAHQFVVRDRLAALIAKIKIGGTVIAIVVIFVSAPMLPQMVDRISQRVIRTSSNHRSVVCT